MHPTHPHKAPPPTPEYEEPELNETDGYHYAAGIDIGQSWTSYVFYRIAAHNAPGGGSTGGELSPEDLWAPACHGQAHDLSLVLYRKEDGWEPVNWGSQALKTYQEVRVSTCLVVC